MSSCPSDLQECSRRVQCTLLLAACPHGSGEKDACEVPLCFVTAALLPNQASGSAFQVPSLWVMSLSDPAAAFPPSLSPPAACGGGDGSGGALR